MLGTAGEDASGIWDSQSCCRHRRSNPTHRYSGTAERRLPILDRRTFQAGLGRAPPPFPFYTASEGGRTPADHDAQCYAHLLRLVVISLSNLDDGLDVASLQMIPKNLQVLTAQLVR